MNDAGLVLGVVSEADLLLKEEPPDPDADLPLIIDRASRAMAAARTIRVARSRLRLGIG
ncbi:MAG TPA: hypothetical protein VJB61_03685 [Actinomycetota bacterium]